MLALAPALSVVIGSIVLGEPLSLTIGAGVCLVVVGFVAGHVGGELTTAVAPPDGARP